jgi:hypothetical protein
MNNYLLRNILSLQYLLLCISGLFQLIALYINFTLISYISGVFLCTLLIFTLKIYLFNDKLRV